MFFLLNLLQKHSIFYNEFILLKKFIETFPHWFSMDYFDSDNVDLNVSSSLNASVAYYSQNNTEHVQYITFFPLIPFP